MSSSPTPLVGSTSARSRSTTGAAKPTESAWSAAHSCGRKVDTEDVSVSPKPLPTRALGTASFSRCTRSGAIGAPPYDSARTEEVSVRAKSGCTSARW